MASQFDCCVGVAFSPLASLRNIHQRESAGGVSCRIGRTIEPLRCFREAESACCGRQCDCPATCSILSSTELRKIDLGHGNLVFLISDRSTGRNAAVLQNDHKPQLKLQMTVF